MRNGTILAAGAAAVLFGGTAALAGNVDVNVHIGAPQVVVPAPVPIPVPPPPAVVIENDVDFIYPSPLGFYVAVGVPYDLFYLNNRYYLFRDGTWFRASYTRGPWVAVRHRELPPGLRKHRVERIRHFRDHEYGIYRRDRDHYRGRHFRSAKEEWKMEKRREKERRKEERHREREERRGGGHGRGHHDD